MVRLVDKTERLMSEKRILRSVFSLVIECAVRVL